MRNNNYLFISYSHRDAQMTNKICKHLVDHRINLWVDKGSIPGGTKWSDEIRDAIDHCTAAIIVFSENYDASENCIHEAVRIKDGNKPVLEIRLCREDYAGSRKDLQEYLDGYQRFQAGKDPEKETEAGIFSYLDSSPLVQLCLDVDAPVIRKIALTGSPGSGKKEAAEVIRNYLESKHIPCMVVPEAAEELVESGVTPDSCRSSYYFQKAVFETQLMLEKQYVNIASEMNKEEVILLCIGGLQDREAYLEAEDNTSGKILFDRIMEENHVSGNELRDRYEAVFFLSSICRESAARYREYCKEHPYQCPDSYEAARELDKRIRDIWKEHHRFRRIYGKYGTQERDRELLRETDNFLEGVHISRKYLIERPEQSRLDALTQPAHIIRTYLVPDVGNDVAEDRVQIWGYQTVITYSRKKKRWVDNEQQIETNEDISAEEYAALLMDHMDPHRRTIRKTRYRVLYRWMIMDIDLYPEWDTKAILEVSMNRVDQELVFPDWIHIIKDVTDDEAYRSSNLAREDGLLHHGPATVS